MSWSERRRRMTVAMVVGVSVSKGREAPASRVSVSGSTEGGVVVMDAGTEAILTMSTSEKQSSARWGRR